jgi:hypothetical protein
MWVTRFFCTKNFKFCFPRWPNFSCQSFNFIYFWVTWTLSRVNTYKHNNLKSLFSFITSTRIYPTLFFMLHYSY